MGLNPSGGEAGQQQGQATIQKAKERKGVKLMYYAHGSFTPVLPVLANGDFWRCLARLMAAKDRK
jgi:hypothetical protein